VAEIQKLAWQLARLPGKEAPVAGLQLSPADCNRLEEITGFGSTRSPEVFLAAVDRLASMRFGDIRVPFTPGQLEEIAHRASKRGRTVQAEMQAVVDRIQDELFHRAPTAPGA